MPLILIMFALVAVGALMGAVIFSTTGNIDQQLEQSEELSAKEREELESYQNLARLRMMTEMADFKSGPASGDFGIQYEYYKDMSYENLKAEYKQLFPARWHALKKDLNL